MINRPWGINVPTQFSLVSGQAIFNDSQNDSVDEMADLGYWIAYFDYVPTWGFYTTLGVELLE